MKWISALSYSPGYNRKNLIENFTISCRRKLKHEQGKLIRFFIHKNNQSMGKKALASGLDNLYADRVRIVERFTILTYSESTEIETQEMLEEWQSSGFIKIIKPVSECEKMEPCIELLSFIQPNLNRGKAVN